MLSPVEAWWVGLALYPSTELRVTASLGIVKEGN
jgi:hypothetical protein